MLTFWTRFPSFSGPVSGGWPPPPDDAQLIPVGMHHAMTLPNLRLCPGLQGRNRDADRLPDAAGGDYASLHQLIEQGSADAQGLGGFARLEEEFFHTATSFRCKIYNRH